MELASILSPFTQQRSGASGSVSRAARTFRKQRLEYYARLADLLEATAGRTTILDVFVRDADRYAGTPRGVLSAHWADRYNETGAKLAETWSGTLPDDDVSLIGVAAERGISSVITALRDLHRVGGVIEESRGEFVKTIAVSLIGVVIACSMLMAIPFLFKPFLTNAFSFVPPENYGALTKRYFALADAIHASWWVVLIAVVCSIGWLVWALPNWVGRNRAWCDDKILLFRLYRDFKGALFLATFASLTKGRGGATTGQRDALLMMQSRSQPWLGWKIGLMVQRIDDRGALDATTLDVGVVDREIFFLISDIYEARGISEGLEIAGLQSEKRASATIAKRAKLLRFALLGGSLAIVLSLLVCQNAVVFEFKKAVSMVGSS